MTDNVSRKRFLAALQHFAEQGWGREDVVRAYDAGVTAALSSRTWTEEELAEAFDAHLTHHRYQGQRHGLGVALARIALSRPSAGAVRRNHTDVGSMILTREEAARRIAAKLADLVGYARGQDWIDYVKQMEKELLALTDPSVPDVEVVPLPCGCSKFDGMVGNCTHITDPSVPTRGGDDGDARSSRCAGTAPEALTVAGNESTSTVGQTPGQTGPGPFPAPCATCGGTPEAHTATCWLYGNAPCPDCKVQKMTRAEVACALNRGELPTDLSAFTPDEQRRLLSAMCNVAFDLVPYDEWIKTWQRQYDGTDD